MLKLRFPESRIAHWAARFPATEDERVLRIGRDARARGFLTKREFLELGEWKSSRQRANRRRNSEALVREATRIALRTREEELKVGVLRLLAGVEWPTASVILHLCDSRKYPILDRRALWSAGIDHPQPSHSFELWHRFLLFTRALSRRTGRSMRDVDRALWQYSKENE